MDNIKNLLNKRKKLISNFNGSEELYDFDTATRIAKEKNELILQEITKILNICD